VPNNIKDQKCRQKKSRKKIFFLWGFTHTRKQNVDALKYKRAIETEYSLRQEIVKIGGFDGFIFQIANRKVPSL
jgi:hypothetical protein